jgi:hypothetical protein
MTIKLNSKRTLVAVMTPEGQRKALDEQLLQGLGKAPRAASSAPSVERVSASTESMKSWLTGSEELMTPATFSQPVRIEGQVQRSIRGTIELISHPTGTSVLPKFQSGILMSVQFQDGSRFVRMDGPLPWVALDAECRIVDSMQIAAVSINQAGVVSYFTADGSMTVIEVDGAISELAA